VESIICEGRKERGRRKAAPQTEPAKMVVVKVRLMRFYNAITSALWYKKRAEASNTHHTTSLLIRSQVS